MGHDKVEHTEVKESREAKGDFRETVGDAHGKEAFQSLQTEKIDKFTDGKIDKIEKIDGKPATPQEKEAMKDIAHAIAKGDLDSLSKAIDKLDPKTAKRVAEGLDEALKGTGVRVHFDGNTGDGMKPNIEIITADKGHEGPVKISDSSNHKIMVPLDGGAPQSGRGDDFYSRSQPQVNSDASGKDLKDACKSLKDAQAQDDKRKQAAGLT